MSSEAITRNDLKAVLDEVLPQTTKNYVVRNTYTSSPSFSNADVPTYINAVLENVRTNINNYSNGIYSVTSGGPVFGVLMFKYSASYWACLVITYALTFDYLNNLYYGKYQNGDCVVIAYEKAS